VRPFQSASDVPLTDFIAFSPAGQIAFTDLGSALTLANPDGGSIIHIPDSGNSLVFAAFDPTGRMAAFVGQTPSSSGGDILVYSSGKYLDVSQGTYDSSQPSFSSSGRAIAYAAYVGELGIQPIYGITVYTFKDHRHRLLTREKQWSDWSPAWSLDDRYIAFVRSVPQEAMYMGSGEIWVMRADGKDAHPLGGVGENPTWVA
jgi:Tol biopolymer transport system component